MPHSPTTEHSLSLSRLLSELHQQFASIPDTTRTRTITLSDCLMSAMAIFGVKYPSLLNFVSETEDEPTSGNLKKLYHINKIPSDTYLRERLDDINPEILRKPFKSYFAKIQRRNLLTPFTYIDGHYLVSNDATGFFASKKIHCDHCCVKKQRDGTLEYYHYMQCAAIVHPERKTVIPFAPEPIHKQDGASKNDCEQRASKRLLENIRREHPHLKIILLADSLHANGPHVELLQQLNMRFIITAKQNANDFNYDDPDTIQYLEYTDDRGYTHSFRWRNDTALNSHHPHLRVSLIDYQETSPKKKSTRFTWVTDLPTNPDTIYHIMRAGRARWRIENETFNTLKNQGYHFEHNFGHGYNNLSNVFAHIMLLAFMIDQIQEIACAAFQGALQASDRKMYFWGKLRAFFTIQSFDAWEEIYALIIARRAARVKKRTRRTPQSCHMDTS